MAVNTKQTLPTFDKMMIPLLKALQKLGGSATVEELDNQVFEDLNFTEEMLEIPHKNSASRSELSYRLAWARTYLKQYGVIDNSPRSVWSFASTYHRDISTLCPREITKFVRDQQRKKRSSIITDTDHTTARDENVFRDDMMQWKDKLRETLLNLSPKAFESLTLRLLRESGFSHVEVTGKSGDNGIDGKGIFRYNGIISFHMIFQCKRYKNSIDPSLIRDFRGAMQGRADKGLFITTGKFTAAAKKEATRDGAPAIDLIDGDALIEKLIELELGIKKKIITTYEYEIDEEWFGNI